MSKKHASKSGESAADADEASPYPVLRVFRTPNSGPPLPGGQGYHPAIAVNLAAAHRWVSYSSFITFLRRLMKLDLDDSWARSQMLKTVECLGEGFQVPFAVGRRFPEEGIYVCVDRSPVGSLIVRLMEALRDMEKSRAYYDAVCLMVDVVTGEDSTRSTGLPVIYTRWIFEWVFQLQWRD